VYFGYVDQRDDDHRLIRGHTVSATHQDNHYCIGTVRGYDVMLVLRNDVIRVPSGKEKRCHWLIVTVDLHTKTDVPHCYVGHKSRDDEFAASYRQLHPLAIGGLGRYPHAFSSNYTVYGATTNAPITIKYALISSFIYFTIKFFSILLIDCICIYLM
jgi:hypothetical protein